MISQCEYCLPTTHCTEIDTKKGRMMFIDGRLLFSSTPIDDCTKKIQVDFLRETELRMNPKPVTRSKLDDT